MDKIIDPTKINSHNPNRWYHADINFPLTEKQYNDEDLLKGCVQPFLPSDDRVVLHPKDYLAPFHPEDGADFWAEFAEVALRVNQAKKKTKFEDMPDELKSELMPEGIFNNSEFLSDTLKRSFKIRTAYDLAKLVEMDYPTDIMVALCKNLMRKKYKLRNLFPNKGMPFTDGIVLVARLIGEIIHRVSPTAFAFKYYHGKLRPQMVAKLWAQGKLDASKGFDVLITSLLNDSSKKEIALNEGLFPLYLAPPHCSFLAMHASLASMQLLFAVMFELDEAGLEECRKTGYGIALGRDFGGVHYRSDSLYGLHIGEEAFAKIFPKMLGELGADVQEIEGLIKENRTNWADRLEINLKRK